MAFQLTPEIKIHRDKDGVIRQIDHSNQPFQSATVSALTAREVAEEYLREVAPYFGLEAELSQNLMQEVTQAFSPENLEIRFSKEKKIGGISIVTFHQSIHGLPIWNSDISVRINSGLSVINAVNEAHYNISLSEYNQENAGFTDEKMDVQKLKKALNINENTPDLTINSTRMLVYQFSLGDRFDNQGNVLPSGGEPKFKLPELNPDKYREGYYYVVSEALFTTKSEKDGSVNWRVLIAADSGEVLYLRSFTSGIQGSIFEIEPTSQGCTTCTGVSSNATLAKYVSQVPLANLNPPVSGTQSLDGVYIALQDLEPPHIAPPTQPTGTDFIYVANADGFAGVNAYYHCNLYFDYIKSLGIDVSTYFANTAFPIPTDARAKNNAVNASCGGNAAGNGVGNLLFGIVQAGNTVGIASDLRVVWHEFGHALLWNHVHSPNFGFAHSAGDAMACIYADPSSQCPDKGLTFPFMTASNPGFANRRNDRTVAQGWAWFGSQYNTQYNGEQVLSSTLFRVYLCTGGSSQLLAYKQFASQYMFYLIVQSCGLLTQTTTDPVVYVEALKTADMNCQDFMLKTGQTGGTNYKVIRWSFMQQGLFQPAGTPPPITTIGQPPEVDIYINDGRNGSYEWTDNWTNSPGIWNRLSADGGTTNQQPVTGVTNYLYVTLSNLGLKNATNITIKGYQSDSQNGFDWPINWGALQTAQILTPGPVPPNGSTVVGPFEWTPEFQTDNGVLMVASNAEDPSILDNPVIQNKSLGNWRLVPFDNNIAQRIF